MILWISIRISKNFNGYPCIDLLWILDPGSEGEGTRQKSWCQFYVFMISPLSPPKLRYFARSGPPFVIRSVFIGWGCPGLQMVDLSERENGLWGRERGDRANIEYAVTCCRFRWWSMGFLSPQQYHHQKAEHLGACPILGRMPCFDTCWLRVWQPPFPVAFPGRRPLGPSQQKSRVSHPCFSGVTWK